MKQALFILFFMLPYLDVSAQATVSSPPLIQQMLDEYVFINKSKTMVEGWRIQLTASTDRQKVEREKAKFRSLYPEIRYVDWTHASPYYRLRAGAFETKLEAKQLLYQIKRFYSGAYPVKDNKIPIDQITF